MNTAEKGRDNQKSIRDCSICNNHSSVQIHQFISPEVLEDDYLESTLEILQQFYIKMHSDHNYYCLIPGDLRTIGKTLYHAPSAILHHWEMIDHQDHPIHSIAAFDLSHVPVLFLGMDTYVRGQASFLATLTNIGDNDRDGIFCSRENGAKKGEHELCEAVKVDVSKTKETNFQASITNTTALVSVIFEDFGVAVEQHKKAKKKNKLEVTFPSGHSI